MSKSAGRSLSGAGTEMNISSVKILHNLFISLHHIFPLITASSERGACGERSQKVDKDLRRRCKEYYIAHYGTEEQFRQEFYYVS